MESKAGPEYFKVYDKDCVNSIDKYYRDNNMNLSVLSKFRNWITITPKRKNRKRPLEDEFLVKNFFLIVIGNS